ncbi:5739_t:CDS:2 [Acaulospora colombiana]|uniref:5739_t:CDS:1 n=1 Tax=Acaulospora colombiana TaxID=27376 RepID=A0ACA9M1I2_9GLOM|nr:5739_t:CDS:2 [Acaulospora colombiana]
MWVFFISGLVGVVARPAGSGYRGDESYSSCYNCPKDDNVGVTISLSVGPAAVPSNCLLILLASSITQPILPVVILTTLAYEVPYTARNDLMVEPPRPRLKDLVGPLQGLQIGVNLEVEGATTRPGTWSNVHKPTLASLSEVPPASNMWAHRMETAEQQETSGKAKSGVGITTTATGENTGIHPDTSVPTNQVVLPYQVMFGQGDPAAYPITANIVSVTPLDNTNARPDAANQGPQLVTIMVYPSDAPTPSGLYDPYPISSPPAYTPSSFPVPPEKAHSSQ